MASLSAIARAVALVVVTLLTRGAEPQAPQQQSIPGVARDDAADYTVLMAGRLSGTQTVRRTADGEYRVVFEFNDRGRGPRLTQRAVLDAAGIPTLIETEGNDYLKKPVRERFSIERRKADWKSSAEQGSRAVSAPAFYVTFEGAPVELGWLARALLAAPERRLALLPDGEARIEWIGTLQLSSKGRSRTVTQHEITGLGLTPAPVWLDEDGGFFPAGSELFMTIRAGWEDSASALTAVQARRTSERQRSLAKVLARKPRGPLVITHARVFEPERIRMSPPATIVIAGNRVAQVGPDGTIPIPRDAEVVDAAGKSVLPGLWDMHVHLNFESGALMNIAAGVTSVRDLGNDTDRLLEARREYDEGTTIGPRVILAGMVDGPGQYARRKVLVDSPGEATQAVDRTKRARLGRAKRDLALILLMHDRGLRRGECGAMDLKHFRDDTYPKVAVIGKGRTEPELLTIAGPTRDALVDWIKVRGDSPGPLFIRMDPGSEPGALERLGGDGASRMVKRLGEKAGLSRGARAHGLRHHAIIRLCVKTNGNIPEVHAFARHLDPRTTIE
jgi:Phage integrase family